MSKDFDLNTIPEEERVNHVIAHYMSWNMIPPENVIVGPTDDDIEKLIMALHGQVQSVFDVRAQAIIALARFAFERHTKNKE